jgi:two-component system response regulator BaeR
MVARVKAVLRRLQAQTTDALTLTLKLILDHHSFRVHAEGNEVELTTVEFQLLQVLYQQPGRIFSRSKLMNLIYLDQRIVSDRTIDSHIKKLRKKLADLLPDQELIHSVYGAGYRYDPQDRVVD